MAKESSGSVEWIPNLNPENLLLLLDVALDIDRELEINPNCVVIPKLPTKIRFSEFNPYGSTPRWQEYGESRMKALSFLKSKGVVISWGFHTNVYKSLEENKMQVQVDPVSFRSTLEQLRQEHSRRSTSMKKAAPSSPVAARDGIDEIRRTIKRFHFAVLELKRRHENRGSIDIADEYDVQDLLRVLLSIHFDDVRCEAWTPHYAGKCSRVDFYIPREAAVIEVKRTSSRMREKHIADQLIVDAERYRQMSGCKHLFCMVYDPEHKVANPQGLASDLSRDYLGLTIELLIVPPTH
jgi:hypothetical protein